MEGEHPILEMKGISKRVPGVQALSGVDFRLLPGEVHALMGQNGAGKSTLIKVMTGVHPPDAGTILLEGKPIAPRSPQDAQDLGISTVYQEVNLCPNLSVAENIFLGRGGSGTYAIDWRTLRRRAEALLADALNLRLDVTATLSDYPIATQQMVAIARALAQQAKILILDEPTSSLAEEEVQQLFAVIRSEISNVWSRTWVMKRIASPCALSREITENRRVTSSSERLEVGSSRIRIRACC